MITTKPEQFEADFTYLTAAAGGDVFKHWLRVKWTMALAFQTQGVRS